MLPLIRILTAVILFVSSYAPLGLIVAVLNFEWDKKTFKNPTISITIVICSIVAAATPLVILRAMKGGKLVTVASVSNRTGDLVNYALPYLVTFVGLKIDDVSSVISFGLFMALFCWLSVKTQALWVNPLLALFGYYLYEISYSSGDTVESAMVVTPAKLLPGYRCRVTPLTEFQLYVTEPDVDERQREATRRDERSVTPDQED